MIETQRSDIVVLADRSGRYTGKSRPALVLQSDFFSGTDSLVVCLITATQRAAPLLRAELPANERTGLSRSSWVQIEKITAVSRQQIGQRIGQADDTTMLEVIRKLAVLLGMG